MGTLIPQASLLPNKFLLALGTPHSSYLLCKFPTCGSLHTWGYPHRASLGSAPIAAPPVTTSPSTPPTHTRARAHTQRTGQCHILGISHIGPHTWPEDLAHEIRPHAENLATPTQQHSTLLPTERPPNEHTTFPWGLPLGEPPILTRWCGMHTLGIPSPLTKCSSPAVPPAERARGPAAGWRVATPAAR